MTATCSRPSCRRRPTCTRAYGGVVPEVASRRHLDLVAPVVREALDSAGVSLDRVEHVAVTQGPGLVGALLVGVSAAKAIAWARRLPLVPVDHLEGHVASLYLEPEPLEPPFLCLLASGGHTLLLAVREHGRSRAARDDARRRRRARRSTRERGFSGSAIPGAPRSTGSRRTETRAPFRFPSREFRVSTSPSRASRRRCSTRCAISERRRPSEGEPTLRPRISPRSFGHWCDESTRPCRRRASIASPSSVVSRRTPSFAPRFRMCASRRSICAPTTPR